MSLLIDDIGLSGLTADPSVLADGCIWYRSDLKEYRIYKDGVIEVLAVSQWRPNSVPLGSLLSSGATFFINDGAGVYLSMADGADSMVYFNDTLNKSGSNYDGSDLKMRLHCRISQNGGVGDDVGLIVDYAIIKDGDNSATTVTSIAQQNVDISSELQDINFDIDLGTMTGVVGANVLMFSLTRNSQGAGADSFTGALEIIGMELIIV